MLLLQHHGICSAITWYGSSPDYAGRTECLRLLIRTLYNQLAGSLRETVAATENVTPPNSVRELIAGREWLFEGMSSYIDSTHLVSILRFAPDLEDPEMLRMALEMAEYGCRLSPMFHFRGDPPFEDVHLDHAVYLKACSARMRWRCRALPQETRLGRRGCGSSPHRSAGAVRPAAGSDPRL
jgi:hypothetical protein